MRALADQLEQWRTVPMDFTGDVDTCTPGTTSQQFRVATRDTVNAFRNLTGLPDVAVSDALSQDALAAALMMSANDRLNHYPPPTWACHSTVGAATAGISNLALGAAGPDAIELYLDDPGLWNSAVGHRRWLLWPRLGAIGTGDVAASDEHFASNALVVLGSEPAPRADVNFVAWPNAGYTLRSTLPSSSRWSFSLPQADFRTATVTLTGPDGTAPAPTEPIANGYGDPTLVFAGPTDRTGQFVVDVDNVTVGGATRNYRYTVTVVDA